MAIEQILENMYCPSCKRQTNFAYVGIQLGKDKLGMEKRIVFYNCGECYTTLNKETIEEFTRQVKEVMKEETDPYLEKYLG